MEAEKKQRKSVNIRYVWLRLALVLLDILSVNLAYFAALIIRFYVNFEINEWAEKYFPAFVKFAPVYTVLCIVVFTCFRLYNSRWRYAGLSDLNRIFMANIVTGLVQLIGTNLLTMRMPITYYVIGWVIQFGMMAVCRFAYRVIGMEVDRAKAKKRSADTVVNVMVIGVGETAHLMLRHMERDTQSAARPVCMVDFRADGYGDRMEGIPVIGGIDGLKDAAKKYGVECVILADTTMPANVRKAIRSQCGELGIEVQDYGGYFQESRGAVTLRGLMEYAKGPVELIVNGTSQKFDNGEQAVLSVAGKYVISTVSAKEGRLVVELQKDILVPNDVKEDWVQSYEQESGEDISFF